jgi:hypothetical protein
MRILFLMLLVVAGLLLPPAVVAQSIEFRYVKAYPEMSASYPRLVCEGNE